MSLAYFRLTLDILRSLIAEPSGENVRGQSRLSL